MNITYDLIIIGAGPGGYVAAIKAAKLKKSVLLIEKGEVGGTCLNRGCIPTKALLHSSELYKEFLSAEKFGITASDIKVDFSVMHTRKDEVILRLRTGIEGLIKANKIDFLQGEATITGSGTVSVNSVKYNADKILIATGSVPVIPPIDGIDTKGVYTSDDLLKSGSELFKSLIIIGGGVIGVEFATLYNALGCEVTIIEACDRILPTLDKSISQNLSMQLKKRGIKIFTSSRVEKINEGVVCEFSCKDKTEEIKAEGILVAVGRRANTKNLFDLDFPFETERGMIGTGECYETPIKGIFAIGDVVKGSIQLAHFASAQGINAVCAMFNEKIPIDMSVVPSCIYTNPEIATVGLSQEEAAAKGIAAKTGKFIMSANGKTIIEDGERGFINLVFDEKTDIILGAQLMCSRATDMISELSTAIAAKLTLEQLAGVIRPHPTYNEGITEALEDLLGGGIHTMPKLTRQ